MKLKSFLLGGDSTAAIKLASEARAEGVEWTVDQMFQNQTLYSMASIMEEIAIINDIGDQIPPFSLLGDMDSSEFVESVVRPQLAMEESLQPLQHVAVKVTTQLPRFSTRYELIFFYEVVDVDHLNHSCTELLPCNEILRTVFIGHEGQRRGVVLESLNADFVVYTLESYTTQNIEAYATNLCHSDVISDMPPGSSFVKWFLVKHTNGKSCLVFGLSHAQYDEICLPILLKQPLALYEKMPL